MNQNSAIKDGAMMLKFDQKGLIPAVIQDVDSSEVLMVGYMNEESAAPRR